MKHNLLIAILLLSLTSCSTIMNGRYQQVAFNSDPPGANVWVDSQLRGTTPTFAYLKRSKPYTVCIDLEGYKPYQVQLVPMVSGWVFGNIIFGGVIGVAVDVLTGSMHKLSPNQLNAFLVSENHEVITHIKASEECQVMVLSRVDPTWERIGSLERA